MTRAVPGCNFRSGAAEVAAEAPAKGGEKCNGGLDGRARATEAAAVEGVTHALVGTSRGTLSSHAYHKNEHLWDRLHTPGISCRRTALLRPI